MSTPIQNSVAARSNVAVWLTPPVVVPAAIVLLIAVYTAIIHMS